MLSKVRIRILAFGLLFVMGASALAADVAPESREATNARILARHNAERARVGVPPLAWDERLATSAARWAQHLAATRSFEHAPDGPANDLQGENLWMGSVHSYSPEEMVDGWIDERADFVPGIFPHVTRTKHWEDVGHYTQLIWANTKRIGCAIASNQTDDYLVCRYSAPGNWVGENPMTIRR